MKWILPVLSSLFFLAACKTQKRGPDPEKIAADYKLIRQFQPLVRSGDMIFRNGTDEVSYAARHFNRHDTSYSHCGLLMIEHDSIFVYHALGGVYNPSQRLMRQPLDSFCNPAENNAIAVYRYPLSDNQTEKLAATIQQYYLAGIRFDMFFDFKSDDKFYCSEFVFKSLNRALDSSISSWVRLDTIPYGVTTDDLFLQPGIRLVKKQQFLY